jgi:uncharacterized protein (DUF4415 family)
MKRASLEEIRQMKNAGELTLDLPTVEPEDLGADFWKDAEVVEPRAPKSVHLKLDPEVFEFFKSRGKGHLTRMQEVLRAYVRAHHK